MNRVRVVAVTAVVLGVAVVAGTQFQKSQELVGTAAQQASVIPASPTSRQPVTLAANVPAASGQGLATPTPNSRDMAASNGATSGITQPQLTRPVSAIPTAEMDQPTPSMTPVASPRLATASILSATDLLASPLTDSAQSGARSADIGTLQLAAVEDITPVVPLDDDLQTELAACAVWVVVTPSVGAMLDASIYAPCDRDASVRVSHAGLTFDSRIGADGQMMLLVPALVDEATLTVTFNDGRTQSDTTFVPDLNTIERVALQWEGPAELLLHAYEFGAQYGEDGHIFAGNMLSPTVEGHGFLTILGEPQVEGGHMVQVYSYPSGQSSRTGSVTLEIEAPITEASCGFPLEAESIEMRAAAPIRNRDIRLDMPECDGSGGYVVLPGVLPDLQVAALQ